MTRAQGRRHYKNKGHYAAQFAITENNRLAKRIRHLNSNPNDNQAKELWK